MINVTKLQLNTAEDINRVVNVVKENNLMVKIIEYDIEYLFYYDENGERKYAGKDEIKLTIDLYRDEYNDPIGHVELFKILQNFDYKPFYKFLKNYLKNYKKKNNYLDYKHLNKVFRLLEVKNEIKRKD